MIAGVLYNLGDLGLKLGDRVQARTALRESLSLRQEIGETGGVAECLEGFARLALLKDRAGDAARLFGAASVMREAVGAPLAPANQPDHDRALDETRQSLGGGAFQDAWRTGSELALERAVALALTI